MSRRPRRATKPDANHDIVPRALEPFNFRGAGFPKFYRADYHGQELTVIDTQSFGGLFPDWMIFSDAGWFLLIEVKVSEKFKLTPGERLAKEILPRWAICWNELGVLDFIITVRRVHEGRK
jgi:hypothetical protein